MSFKFYKVAVFLALGAFCVLPVNAEDNSNQTQTTKVENELPTIDEAFDGWEQTQFSFEALISGKRGA